MHKTLPNASRNKQREVITINCGGYGVNIGESILQQFAVEQGISSLGTKERKTTYDGTIPILFNETKNGNYTSRSLFTDLNPYSINNITTKCAFAGYLINGNHDACLNFAMGRYSQGKTVIDCINDAVRKLVEETDNLQGFLFNHSLSGGTGGGLTSLILENIDNNYRKKINFGMNVLFDEYRASSSEIYNSLLSVHYMLEYMDVDIIFDNNACNNLCKTYLNIARPTYQNYNKLLTKLIGDITAATRFGINETLHSIYVDMVGFPRIKWLTSSMWPLIARNKKNMIFQDDMQTLTTQCLESRHFIIDVLDFDVEEDKTSALSFCCRGRNIEEYICQTNAAMNFMSVNRKFYYMEFSAGKPMLKFVDGMAAKLASDDMYINDKQISMLANNMWISRLFTEQLIRKYDILYENRKCYVHNYISEGMEESEFVEAREDIGFLEKDYLDLYTGMLTESEEEEDEDD